MFSGLGFLIGRNYIVLDLFLNIIWRRNKRVEHGLLVFGANGTPTS